MKGAPTETSPIDARLTVVMSALEPALSLARVLHLSLDDFSELTATGYFSLLSRRGLSWQAAAKRLGKSRRTIASLAKRAGSTDPLLSGSQRMQWRRRIVRLLAEEEQQTFEQVSAMVTDAPPDDLRAEVEQLVDEGVLEQRGDGLRVNTHLFDLLSSDFDQRIESLRHFLEAVTHVVYRRFLSRESEAEAFARVLTFSARRQDLAEIRDIYQVLEARVFAADAAAEGDPTAVQASVTMCVVETPTDVLWKVRRRS